MSKIITINFCYICVCMYKRLEMTNRAICLYVCMYKTLEVENWTRFVGRVRFARTLLEEKSNI